MQTSHLTGIKQLERTQRHRWRLSFSSLSDAVTGTRDVRRALLGPRRKPVRPHRRSARGRLGFTGDVKFIDELNQVIKDFG